MVRLLMIPSLALALSCAGPSAGKGERLYDASRSLRDGLLFLEVPHLAGLLQEELRGDFLQRAYELEEALSVTEVEILSLSMDQGGERATTTTRISYFELPSTVLHREVAVVGWVLHHGEWKVETIDGGPLPIPAL